MSILLFCLIMLHYGEALTLMRVVDYQHGIIFDGHDRYIKDGQPPMIKLSNNVVTMVYGDTFKNILINNDESNFYNDKNVIKVGLNKSNNPQKLI